MSNIERFIRAQECQYDLALSEIKNGQKVGHWIWYIFPQISSLGRSEMAVYYGIDSIGEAKDYLENPILKSRLIEISTALLSHSDKSAVSILGEIDAKKVCSSMTLFDGIMPNSVFEQVLNAFYDGKRCKKTLNFLSNDGSDL